MKNILECKCQRKGLKCFKKTNSWIFLISRHFSWYSIPYTSYFWKTQTYLTCGHKIIPNMQKCNSVKLKFYYHQSHNKYQGRLLLSLHTLLTCINEFLVQLRCNFYIKFKTVSFIVSSAFGNDDFMKLNAYCTFCFRGPGCCLFLLSICTYLFIPNNLQELH